LMIRIAISVEAFERIARTLPLGSVGYEAEANQRGEREISGLRTRWRIGSARCGVRARTIDPADRGSEIGGRGAAISAPRWPGC
jgi:hypothetical protein